MTRFDRFGPLALMALLCGLALAPSARAGETHAHDPHALWKIVHDRCAPAAARGIYPPTPCAAVHAGPGGTAVLKDRRGAYQYLVLPLARIPGIESPALVRSDAPNYLAVAWQARLYVEAALGAAQPRGVLGLVVNSPEGRSQDQLHIHVDCMRRDVHDALVRALPLITHRWHWLPAGLPPSGHRYMARWVDGARLHVNPFADLARALPAGDGMAQHGLAVVGASRGPARPGFILLSDRIGHGDRANIEELQDVTCALADRTPLP
ncbi:MAG: CDP-diacylglycerol diphosphatase [Xanthomonadaceae bacterium]|nr:CDP-diacylglycerol diphosphatase [Xanthomonadaceae bacterium]MDE1963763.1 CDP-diacylglycerol diphosphatase [Xanthomonadaceae bacterium]